MKATATKEFKGVPDGQHYPVKFAVGDDVHGDLACVAVENGWADVSRSVSTGTHHVDVAAVESEVAAVMTEDDEPVKRKRGRPRNDD